MFLVLTALHLLLFVTTLLAIKLRFCWAFLIPLNASELKNKVTFLTYFLKVRIGCELRFNLSWLYMLPLNLQKLVEQSHMSERQSVSAVPSTEPQLDWFWKFFPFFLHKKRMTKWKSIFTPTTKEPKICHALATTSAVNLKLCHMTFITKQHFVKGSSTLYWVLGNLCIIVIFICHLYQRHCTLTRNAKSIGPILIPRTVSTSKHLKNIEWNLYQRPGTHTLNLNSIGPISIPRNIFMSEH